MMMVLDFRIWIGLYFEQNFRIRIGFGYYWNFSERSGSDYQISISAQHWVQHASTISPCLRTSCQSWSL